MKKSFKFMTVFILSFVMLLSVTNIPNDKSNTVQAATYVYVTKTGKHYFYNRNDRGLNRAKKVYRVTLSTAKKRGLTVAGTVKKVTKKKVAKKKVVKKVIKKPVVKKTVKKPVRKVVKKIAKKKVVAATKANKGLSTLNYKGSQIVTVNSNRPTFSKATLSTAKGAWQTYSNLDRLNRATDANAMLNKRLMPHSTRQPLYVTPTGWHNKKTKSGWLYNRSHLIGYQLTGQNNNPKNLITGTRSLNDPAMLKYENQVTKYIKSSSKHYVRYEVKPIFKGNNLLVSGVQMQGQSIGSNAVHFNIYIFNIEHGYKLNYANGTSKVA